MNPDEEYGRTLLEHNHKIITQAHRELLVVEELVTVGLLWPEYTGAMMHLGTAMGLLAVVLTDFISSREAKDDLPF